MTKLTPKLKNVANTAIALAGGAMAKIGIDGYSYYRSFAEKLTELNFKSFVDSTLPFSPSNYSSYMDKFLFFLRDEDVHNNSCFVFGKHEGVDAILVYHQCYPGDIGLRSAISNWTENVLSPRIAEISGEISHYQDLSDQHLALAFGGTIIAGLGVYGLYKDWKKRKTDDEKNIDKSK